MTGLATVDTTPPSDRTVVSPLRITVLAGGPSAEHEVSLVSGQAVTEGLSALGHDVRQADISPDDLSALDEPADVVFIALHGTFGEDGQLQRILEQRGVPFCGSGSVASERAMNKVDTKRCFVERGITTPRFDVIRDGRLDQALASWPVPVVLKPIAEGSSVGCSIVHDADELRVKARALVDQYGECMIEEFIDGPELTVGILGERALPPIEIRTHRSFYDYAAKYQDDDTEYVFETDLPESLLGSVQRQSLDVFRELGCRDFGRVDWMVDRQRGVAYALEVNTIPGFTDHSLLPKAAARAGVPFHELCGRIVDLAMQR